MTQGELRQRAVRLYYEHVYGDVEQEIAQLICDLVRDCHSVDVIEEKVRDKYAQSVVNELFDY